MGAALTIGSTVAAVAGTAMSAVGAAQQAHAQEDAEQFQAQQMQLQAQQAATQGAEQEAARRRVMQQNLGTTLAFYGSRDVSGDSPGVRAMMDNENELGLQDLQITGMNASMNAMEAGLQASEDESAESSTELAGYLNAGGSLLSGGVNAARTYTVMKRLTETS